MRRPTYRDISLLLLLVILALSYFPINHGTHGGLNNANFLHGAIDRNIPFVPFFAAPYLLFVPLFWLTVLYAFMTGRNFRQLIWTAIVVYAMSDFIYLILQTEMPRQAHPGGGFFNDLVRSIYAHDRPFCDLPSEHASSAMLFVLYWWGLAGQKFRWLAGAIGVSVIASTVLIKQHSFLGAGGGVALALDAWPMVKRRLTKPVSAGTLET